jgi:hypothetical protein
MANLRADPPPGGVKRRTANRPKLISYLLVIATEDARQIGAFDTG